MALAGPSGRAVRGPQVSGLCPPRVGLEWVGFRTALGGFSVLSSCSCPSPHKGFRPYTKKEPRGEGREEPADSTVP